MHLEKERGTRVCGLGIPKSRAFQSDKNLQINKIVLPILYLKGKVL